MLYCFYEIWFILFWVDKSIGVGLMTMPHCFYFYFIFLVRVFNWIRVEESVKKMKIHGKWLVWEVFCSFLWVADKLDQFWRVCWIGDVVILYIEILWNLQYLSVKFASLMCMGCNNWENEWWIDSVPCFYRVRFSVFYCILLVMIIKSWNNQKQWKLES